ncbi:MAG TPA: HAMP domain-containing sensor histidine kinase [Polyangiaceae bacterium]|jgi:signal transduction histidine kinase|nr:HAMP domain-containing sensor histidine kinase [Polyangiaceae bacterium]
MLLHEFMSEHREEILFACEKELLESSADRSESEVSEFAEQFFDETLRALRRDSGVPGSPSPLPGKSETAARFGADRQRAGVPVMHVPRIFAAISQALGQVGARYALTISAEEYKRLNSCLDSGIATSIENFWRRDRDRENRLITEHFGFLAHELRNALGNANMAFKLLRQGELAIDGPTGDVLARNLALMESLVAQCLGSARLEVGDPPALVPTRVATVLHDLEAASLPDRGIRIELDVDESLQIAGDEMLLGSAIGNLLHNAVKFSPPESKIHLRASASADSVVIDVEDECGGLHTANPEDFFKPYVKEQRGNHQGTGLGLAISKRAIEAMGGSIRVIDNPGHGCTFSARFPRLPG